MEQKTLSKSAIAQIAGSAVILLGAFMSWISAGGSYGLTLGDLFKMMKADAAVIIPYAVAILALANILVVYSKHKKMLSVVLAICALLLAAFVVVSIHDASELKGASLDAGFYFAVIGIIALIFGIVTKNK